MPREVLLLEPGKLVFNEYDEPPLKPNEIRVRSVFSSEKHGTMLAFYRGTAVWLSKSYDPDLALFVERKGGELYPMHVGNMTAGVVIEVGENVREFKEGDRVFGYLPIRETHAVPGDSVWLAPAEVAEEELVCIDPAVVALMGVREGAVKLGDTVAVVGLGAIGLLTVQMAKLSGALTVVGIDPVEGRRRLAEEYGADFTIDPRSCDAGFEVKRIVKGGVDVVIEASGSYQALHQAMRAVKWGGRVVPVSWYQGEARGLYLGEEFHHNRLTVISGARVESEPYREYPLWNRRRVYDTVLDLFKRRALTVKGMLKPIVKFDEVIEAYRLIDEQPENAIKLGVKYS